DGSADRRRRPTRLLRGPPGEVSSRVRAALSRPEADGRQVEELQASPGGPRPRRRRVRGLVVPACLQPGVGPEGALEHHLAEHVARRADRPVRRRVPGERQEVSEPRGGPGQRQAAALRQGRRRRRDRRRRRATQAGVDPAVGDPHGPERLDPDRRRRTISACHGEAIDMAFAPGGWRKLVRAGAVATLTFVAAAAALAAPIPAPGDRLARQLRIANKPWTGDFDRLLERRMIRVYAPFSRSLYFSDKGRERGIAVELVRDWERYLNIKHAK